MEKLPTYGDKGKVVATSDETIELRLPGGRLVFRANERDRDLLVELRATIDKAIQRIDHWKEPKCN